MGIDYTTGAWRGFAAPKGLPADIANALTAALKKVNEAAEFREFMANRGFGVQVGRRCRLRQVHGRGQQGDGRGHEGRRPRQDLMHKRGPAASSHAIIAILPLGIRSLMQLSDRVTGLFLVALGGLAAYGGSRLPPVPGQQIGPNVFPDGGRHRPRDLRRA